jgi:death-on-curing protein
VREPIWVRTDVVLAIHHRQLVEHGGQTGVRDVGLLESALARPRNAWAYAEAKPDLVALAAAYAFGLMKNHAFVDGNKRTALVVCRTFLRLNGLDIDATPEEKYVTFLKLAAGEVREDELVAWLKTHARQAE